MSPTSPSRAKAGEKKEDGDHKPPLNPAVLQQVKVLLRHIDAIDTTHAVELAVKIFDTREAARKRLLQVLPEIHFGFNKEIELEVQRAYTSRDIETQRLRLLLARHRQQRLRWQKTVEELTRQVEVRQARLTKSKEEFRKAELVNAALARDLAIFRLWAQNASRVRRSPPHSPRTSPRQSPIPRLSPAPREDDEPLDRRRPSSRQGTRLSAA
jgi:hypothetical protein